MDHQLPIPFAVSEEVALELPMIRPAVDFDSEPDVGKGRVKAKPPTRHCARILQLNDGWPVGGQQGLQSGLRGSLANRITPGLPPSRQANAKRCGLRI